MRFRKLRIAFSVTCGIACVLLIVLWVRSYFYVEQVLCTIDGHFLFVVSLPGVFGVNILPEEFVEPWIVYRLPAKEWLTSGHAAFLGRLCGGFYIGNIDGPIVMAPYWLWCLIPATLAVAPWIHRFKRFSLRTLLIATTLVAVVLGLIV
jgi:hypothetical protein